MVRLHDLMDRVVSNEGPLVGSTHESISAVDACELYGHAEKTIPLLLVVGGEGILVQDDVRYVVFTDALANSGSFASMVAMRLTSLCASSGRFKSRMTQDLQSDSSVFLSNLRGRCSPDGSPRANTVSQPTSLDP